MRRNLKFIIPVLCLIIAGLTFFLSEERYDLPDDVPSLIEMMGDYDMGIHRAAARKLKKNYGKEPFLIAIKHENSYVRTQAALFLGFFNDASLQDILIETSTDSDAHVRMYVALSLGRIGNSKSLSVLNILAKDKESIVRSEAEEAIKQIQKRID